MFKDLIISLKPWVVFRDDRYEFDRELDVHGLGVWISDAFWWQDPAESWGIKVRQEEGIDEVVIIPPKSYGPLRLRPVYAGMGTEPLHWYDASVEEENVFLFRIKDKRWFELFSRLEEPTLRLRLVDDNQAMAIPELMARLPRIGNAPTHKRRGE